MSLWSKRVPSTWRCAGTEPHISKKQLYAYFQISDVTCVQFCVFLNLKENILWASGEDAIAKSKATHGLMMQAPSSSSSSKKLSCSLASLSPPSWVKYLSSTSLPVEQFRSLSTLGWKGKFITKQFNLNWQTPWVIIVHNHLRSYMPPQQHVWSKFLQDHLPRPQLHLAEPWVALAKDWKQPAICGYCATSGKRAMFKILMTHDTQFVLHWASFIPLTLDNQIYYIKRKRLYVFKKLKLLPRNNEREQEIIMI